VIPPTARGAWDWRLALLVLLPFLALWAAPLFDLDEGAFTASTTEMFLRGDYLSSHLLGEPRYDKPILTYWLQAVSALVFGFDELGFRLPSAMAAALWIVLTHAFSNRIAYLKSEHTAALIIATAAGLTLIQRAATADALLNLWLAIACYSAWLWLLHERPGWRYAAFAAMALGFLTKGPVAVLIPVGAVFLWCASRKEMGRFFRWAVDIKAVALFLAITAPWFIAQYLHDGPGFFMGFFFEHNLARFDAPMEGHGGNYFYYVPVVLLSLLPHTGLLFSALLNVRALWRDVLMRFCLLWFVLVFVLFSFSGTKLPHYVYYGYGGLALVLAHQAGVMKSRWLALLPGTLMFALMLALPDLLSYYAPQLKPDDQLLLAGTEDVFGTGYRLWFGAALAASVVMLLWRGIGLGAALYGNGLLAALGIAAFLIPGIGTILQAPVKAAGIMARQLTGPLVMIGVNTPSFQTYAGRLVEKRTPRSGDLVLTRESKLGLLPENEVLYRQRSYILSRVK